MLFSWVEFKITNLIFSAFIIITYLWLKVAKALNELADVTDVIASPAARSTYNYNQQQQYNNYQRQYIYWFSICTYWLTQWAYIQYTWDGIGEVGNPALTDYKVPILLIPKSDQSCDVNPGLPTSLMPTHVYILIVLTLSMLEAGVDLAFPPDVRRDI